MSVGRTLLRFLLLAGIGHQLTYTIVEGGIFGDMRQRLSRIHPKLDEFVHCDLCVATWTGAVLAAIYHPNLLADSDVRRASATGKVASLAGDALLIALGTRLWNEILGLLRREVQVKQQEIERAEVAAADESSPAEIERAMLPGISIRS